MFCRSLCVLFYFGHCVVCPSIDGFWLPLCYLQTILTYIFMAKEMTSIVQLYIVNTLVVMYQLLPRMKFAVCINIRAIFITTLISQLYDEGWYFISTLITQLYDEGWFFISPLITQFYDEGWYFITTLITQLYDKGWYFITTLITRLYDEGWYFTHIWKNNHMSTLFHQEG